MIYITGSRPYLLFLEIKDDKILASSCEYNYPQPKYS